MVRLRYALSHVRNARACIQGRNGEMNLKKEAKKQFCVDINEPIFFFHKFEIESASESIINR